MISTHWHNHHEPTVRGMHFVDLLARQAADALERQQADEALRARMEELMHSNADVAGYGVRLLALQREVNDLLAQQGKPARYEVKAEA